MSLENGSVPEKLTVPETPEQMVKTHLAFQGFGSAEEKKLRRENALANKKVMESAANLIEAAKKYGMEQVIETGADVQHRMHNDAATNLIPFTDSSRDIVTDRSWSLIDLGLRYKPTSAEAEASQKRGGDPFADTAASKKLREKVADSKLAYYAYRAYNGNFEGTKEWKAIVDAHAALYTDAYPLLRKKGNKSGELSAGDLSKLGTFLHDASERIRAEQIDLSKAPDEPVIEANTEREATEEIVPAETAETNVVPEEIVNDTSAAAEPVVEPVVEPVSQQVISEEETEGIQADEMMKDREKHLQQMDREAEKYWEGVYVGREYERHQGKQGAALDTPDDNDGVASEMRDSLRSLSPSSEKDKEKDSHEKIVKDEVHEETHTKKDGDTEAVSKKKVIKHEEHTVHIQKSSGLLAEIFKPFAESINNMWRVIKKLWKRRFSFAALNESATPLPKKKEKKEDHKSHGHDAHGADHGHKKDDHGHGGHGDHH